MYPCWSNCDDRKRDCHISWSSLRYLLFFERKKRSYSFLSTCMTHTRGRIYWIFFPRRSKTPLFYQSFYPHVRNMSGNNFISAHFRDMSWAREYFTFFWCVTKSSRQCLLPKFEQYWFFPQYYPWFYFSVWTYPLWDTCFGNQKRMEKYAIHMTGKLYSWDWIFTF